MNEWLKIQLGLLRCSLKVFGAVYRGDLDAFDATMAEVDELHARWSALRARREGSAS